MEDDAWEPANNTQCRRGQKSWKDVLGQTRML